MNTHRRELVTLRTVNRVEPIDGADNIELVHVDGWQTVTLKGVFSPGDRCVYFEVDSLLPLADERFSFLRGKPAHTVGDHPYHRLRTVKLRGTISQGLALPAALFPNATAHGIGVLPYEPPPPNDAGDIVGTFPAMYAPKTHAERVQNFTPDEWETIRAHPWVATEKLDGTSITVVAGDDKVYVCSRNWEIGEGKNLYRNAVEGYRLSELPGTGWQGEIVGPGIQGNPLGLASRQVRLFSAVLPGRRTLPLYSGRPTGTHLPVDEYLFLFVPRLNIELPPTVEEAVTQADGLRSTVNPDKMAEGIVWRTLGDVYSPMKVLNNTYLLRGK